MKYVRLCMGVKDKGILLEESKIYDLISPENDWYSSVYYYTEKQYQQFLTTGSIRGIKDVSTNKLVFDFDYEKDPNLAKEDTLKLYHRLFDQGSIVVSDIQIYFSGNKGFNIILELNQELSPERSGDLALKYASDLTTFDSSLYDAPQILRVAGTKHPKSGLYKIPLTYKQLQLPLHEILAIARSMDNITDEFTWSVAAPDDKFYELPKKELKVVPIQEYTLDLSKKPSGWRNCKFSLLQGNFKSGERHEALIRLAATCRGLGYDKQTTYYMCKGALKKQALLHNQDEFPKDELWNNIIEESVFADGWEGGQYTCDKDPWLKRHCESLGQYKCKDTDIEKGCVSLEEMSEKFLIFAKDFEKNIIKTGLIELDDNITLVASTLNGLLGQPGAGKTSKALNFLRNSSKNNIDAMFFSLDMGLPIIYAKLVQKIEGCDFKQALHLYRTNDKIRQEVDDLIQQDYKNVSFNFTSGMTVPDMKKAILDQEQATGKKVKLVIIDYLEVIAGPFADVNANSGFICNQLKDLANELSVCILLLLQTQKHSTSEIADPLLSLKQVKGSSLIEQSMSTILTLWREGYSPNTVEDDNYISFAVVKNRFGSLWRGDFHWDGQTGDIRGLFDEERVRLKEFKAKKQEMKEKADKQWE